MNQGTTRLTRELHDFYRLMDKKQTNKQTITIKTLPPKEGSLTRDPRSSISNFLLHFPENPMHLFTDFVHKEKISRYISLWIAHKSISTAVTTAYKSHRKTCDRVGVTRDMGVTAFMRVPCNSLVSSLLARTPSKNLKIRVPPA